MGLEEGFKYIKKILMASSSKTQGIGTESGSKKTLLAEGFVVALEYLRKKYTEFMPGKAKSRL
jgi:hypothetical protein